MEEVDGSHGVGRMLSGAGFDRYSLSYLHGTAGGLDAGTRYGSFLCVVAPAWDPKSGSGYAMVSGGIVAIEVVFDRCSQ